MENIVIGQYVCMFLMKINWFLLLNYQFFKIVNSPSDIPNAST